MNSQGLNDHEVNALLDKVVSGSRFKLHRVLTGLSVSVARRSNFIVDFGLMLTIGVIVNKMAAFIQPLQL